MNYDPKGKATVARFINLEDGAVFHMGQGFSRQLISPEAGGGNITLNYSVFQDGQEFPQHFHEVSADIFIVLEGSVSVRQGERYTPTRQGEFTYIPPGEVHGTVNDIPGEATLISFQSPPDPALYSGDRDPAQTGVTPQPQSDRLSKVRIASLRRGDPEIVDEARKWNAADPDWGAAEMTLSYLELDPGAEMQREAFGGGETVVFVWGGTAQVACSGAKGTLRHGGAALLAPEEGYAIRNVGSEELKIIRCQASA